MSCPFCKSAHSKNSFYPKNDFNDTVFNYITCKECDLTYLNPLPNGGDYDKMYPPQYQNNKVAHEVLKNPYDKLPGLRFSYGYQFDLIKKYTGNNASIMDYGCGDAHFVVNAQKEGFRCAGAEYNPNYVQMLNQHLDNIECVTIDDLLSYKLTTKYDVIRLSNVLEHLTTPIEVIQALIQCLNPKGILLVEGPIEHNFSLAQTFRNCYFAVTKILNPNRQIQFPPYHIFFSNAKNQKAFFEKLGLQEQVFVVEENTWPFPANLQEAQGIQQKIMAIIAKISIGFTRLFSTKWGNTFIYIGKKP
jgi:2-polyprenyl-3-methyl-5-hydroxy-6-metoxy-1,4-benzoquinol methylase